MTVAVTASRVILANPAVPESVADHRVDYWTWVDEHASPPYKRDMLLGLRDYWRDCNRDYFAGRMLEPYITLTEPSAPQVYGQCCSVSSWGSRLEIKLRPSLLEGTHPHLRGAKAVHRERFTYDVLLHEMIHQHVAEHEPDVDESSYHGHGPVFTAHCNRIGALLGLPEVVVRNRNGDKKPKAAQWPYGVQSVDRYGGFYKPNRRAVTASSDEPDDNGESPLSVRGTIGGKLEAAKALNKMVLTPDMEEALSAYQRFTTDEERARFALHFVGRVTRVINDVLPAMHELLRLIAERELYRQQPYPGAVTHDSFDEYVALKVGPMFDALAQIQSTYGAGRDGKK